MFHVLNKSPKTATILVYGDIGPSWFGDGVSANDFAQKLEEVGNVSEIVVRINSYGGAMMDGLTMYRLLADHPARIVTQVDAMAASAASLIAMAGDEIRVAEAAQIMIHDASSFGYGNAEDFRAQANVLDTASEAAAELYAARIGNGKTAAELRQKMKAETWFTAKQALDYGIATSILANKVGDDVPEEAAKASNVTKLNFKNKPGEEEQISPGKQAALKAFARGQVAISLSRAAIARIGKTNAA